MSELVTVPGPHGTTVNQTFSNFNNNAIALQIANAIAAASTLGALSITTVSGGPTVPNPPSNTVTGAVNELVITAGGVYSIPAGSKGAPDYAVVLNNTAPVTIFGSPNTSVWGGASQVTIVDAAITTLSEGAGNVAATLTGAGEVLAGNNQSDTLTAAGKAETISAGAGANLLIASGANDTISAQGTNDTLVGGSGGATFQIASVASGEAVFAGTGAVSVTDAGMNDTIQGGGGQLNVTTSGSNASVVGATVPTQSGGFNVTDIGIANTIVGGLGATAVSLAGSDALVTGGLGALFVMTTAAATPSLQVRASALSMRPNGSFVRGGAGLLNFVGGTGPSTLIGGSGNATVFGGSGVTLVVGGAGGAVTYANTTSGGLFYEGLSGNETIDASLSKGNSSMWGGSDPTGHNLLIGGTGIDFISAGAGADTLAGGGGVGWFSFFKAVVGPSANDVVSNFSSLDHLVLVGYGPGADVAAIAGATTANGSTTITLSDNTKITFTGMSNPGALIGHTLNA